MTVSLQWFPKWVSWDDTEQSDGGAPVLGLLRIWSIPSLPFLPGLLWLRVIASDRALSMSQIEVQYLNTVQTNYWLNWIVRNRTVWLFNCV